MELRKLGGTGLDVSQLCLGAGMFGDPDNGCDAETARRILDAYLDAGGNFLDVADFYCDGAVEEVVGRIIRGRRDRLVLASKVGMWHGDGANARGLSRRHILDAIDASLRRLGTDHIDLYQVHTVDPWTPLEETLGALDACVRAGKVRYVGCSNFEAWRLMKALGIARGAGLPVFASIQLEYSLVSRAIEREHVPLCVGERVGILPYGVLGAGLLTGKVRRGTPPPSDSRLGKDPRYRGHVSDRSLAVVEALAGVAADVGRTPSQVALAWASARSGVASVIVGARTVEQIADNLGAAGLDLGAEASRILDAASAIRRGYPYELIDGLTAFVAPDRLPRGDRRA